MKRLPDATSPEIRQDATSFIERAKNDKEGRTATHFAAMDGNTPALKYLAENCDFDLQQKDKIGCNPMHYAASRGHQSTINYLIQKRLRVSEKNNFGSTALHYAALAGHDSVVHFLIEKAGANVADKDGEGRTVLDCAYRGEHFKLCDKLLLNYPVLRQGQGEKLWSAFQADIALAHALAQYHVFVPQDPKSETVTAAKTYLPYELIKNTAHFRFYPLYQNLITEQENHCNRVVGAYQCFGNAPK